LIEGRGCEEVLFLPPYSPDLDPIEEAFSKIKGILLEKPLLAREKRFWRQSPKRSVE
jgi:transposase